MTNIQGGAPPSYKWVIIPLTIDISPTKTIVIGLICTNLANELGHHLVAMGFSKKLRSISGKGGYFSLISSLDIHG